MGHFLHEFVSGMCHNEGQTERLKGEGLKKRGIDLEKGRKTGKVDVKSEVC